MNDRQRPGSVASTGHTVASDPQSFDALAEQYDDAASIRRDAEFFLEHLPAP